MFLLMYKVKRHSLVRDNVLLTHSCLIDVTLRMSIDWIVILFTVGELYVGAHGRRRTRPCHD
jgi:hypothetical protein